MLGDHDSMTTLAVKDLDADPDRIRHPMVRDGETWREVTWDEAFAEIERRLRPILDAGDRDAVALLVQQGLEVVHSGDITDTRVSDAAASRPTASLRPK